LKKNYHDDIIDNSKAVKSCSASDDHDQVAAQIDCVTKHPGNDQINKPK